MKFFGECHRRIIIIHSKILYALLNSTLNFVPRADAVRMFMNKNDHTEYISAITQARYGRIRGRQIGNDFCRCRLEDLSRHFLDIIQTAYVMNIKSAVIYKVQVNSLNSMSGYVIIFEFNSRLKFEFVVDMMEGICLNIVCQR